MRNNTRYDCDDCGKPFMGPADPYGTVGIAICGACTGGEPCVGPIILAEPLHMDY